MIRRDFCKSSLLLSAAAIGGSSLSAQAVPRASDEKPAKGPGVTHHVSEFIVNTKFSDIPQDIMELGKKSILDGFGLALAGSVSEIAPLVRQYLKSLSCSDGKASIIGTKMKVPPRFAAFANGVAIHSDDFDDTAMIAVNIVHATVPVLPPVFALCESGHRSGKDLLLAFHVGVEAGCKIAETISPRHFNDGYHPTGTIGSFSSAAACAKLLGLNVQQTSYALGVAAAEAGGLRDNFGSMTKPFQAGHAAENGSVAADLALLGWTSGEDILEAPRGFFRAEGGGFDPAAIINRLGNPWIFTSPGVLLKRFPCGTIQQPAMDEILRLVQQNSISAADVEKVDVGGDRIDVETLFHHRPTTALEGKFSMEFCLSILLLERKATLGQFNDATVQRADVQEMIRRVNFYVSPEVENKMGSNVLKITMKDGRVYTDHGRLAKGSPENPMSYDEVAEKFRGCAEFAKWPAQKTASVIKLVKLLETLPDVRQLTDALTG
ncbi:MAG: MmgE/PrpD family protein [Candidatus Acidiferrum sp.]